MKANVDLKLFLNKNTSILQKHIELLKAVEETKSITKAAAYVGISYKNAWDTLDEINNKSKNPIIVRVQGNTKNSGSELSEYGKNLIKSYEMIQRAQQEFLDKILKNGEIDEDSIGNLQRIGLKLSARNKLLVTITQVQTGAVNSLISAVLSSGEELACSITTESEKNLDLKVGDEILYIFKAPSVIIAKELNPNLKLSASNIIKCKVSEVKIGAVNAQISLITKGHQTITSSITKDSAMALALGVGDEAYAIISQNDIIIGL